MNIIRIVILIALTILVPQIMVPILVFLGAAAFLAWMIAPLLGVG